MTDFSFSWQNVTVKSGKKSNIILDDVSGIAHNNSLIAILGASGSGKTTLLGSISGRVELQSGILKINKQIVNKTEIKSISTYVHQHDIFTDTLTALEYLQFMTALQLRSEKSNDQVRIIAELMSELGLDLHKDTAIRKLSGGEKRRLTLAGSLLNNPRIVFCDEPTTGLDSYSAITVIKKLENIASSGKIVLTTIHQPSSQGTQNEAKEFFESFKLFCPISYNPAEFYIKHITHNQNKNDNITKMSQIFKTRQKPFEEKPTDVKISKIGRNSFKSFRLELRWLTWRCLVDTRRNLIHNILGYLCLMCTGFVISFVYGLVVIGEPNSVQNIQGNLFFIVSEVLFTNMYTVIYIFPKEMSVFLREKSLYSSLPYFLSKFISLVQLPIWIPLSLISSTSFMAIFFVTQKLLSGFINYLVMVLVLFSSTLCACTIGLALSALFPSLEFAELALSPLEIIFMVVSGIYVKIESLPWFFRICRYFSPFFYAFESISNIYWGDVMQIGNCTGVPCFRNGSDVLSHYNFHHNYNVILLNTLSLIILIIFYSIIGFLGIIRKRMLYNAY